MSNNLKNWPKNIQAHAWHQDTYNTMQVTAWLHPHAINYCVEYIRADIVKEREAKLIEELYVTCVAFVDDEDKNDVRKDLEDRELIAGIYRKAGIEEL